MNETQTDRLVLRKEAMHMLGGMCIRTMKRRIATGVLPPETVISDRKRGWPLSVLQRVLHEAGVKQIGAKP